MMGFVGKFGCDSQPSLGYTGCGKK